MKKIVSLIAIILFSSISLYAQYSFDLVECNAEISQDNVEYYIVKKDTLAVRKISNSELEIFGTKYKASEQDVKLSLKVYYNIKLKTFILLADKKVDYNLGCDVLMIKNKKSQHIGEMSVAAYTKDENGRMNYNSILPFVSIVKISDRIIFSFETPLVVIYPGLSEEATLNGRDVYYTYSNSKLQISK